MPNDWTPFRPGEDDLKRLDRDVSAMPRIQKKLVANHPGLKVEDRVAHQYQIAGGKVTLQIVPDLPENLAGVGLFEPNSRHTGVGRISTGQGCPHLETDPDFLGLMIAFQSRDGHRVDFVAINDPGSPTDRHQEFMDLLDAVADAAGAEAPFGNGLGEQDLLDLVAGSTRLVRSLIASNGVKRGGGIALHVLHQTLRTAKSSTAYQTYWTGIVEAGGIPGKFAFVPITDENHLRSLQPGERHLTEEWHARQARGPLTFNLLWLPFIDDKVTSLVDLTEGWEERPQPVGKLAFPQSDGESSEDRLWAALAAEMGANPGNWVSNTTNSIAEPGTEFTCARKIAYRRSQAGRGVLPEEAYADVFHSGEIGSALADELNRRRAKKRELGHVDAAQ